MNTSNNKLVLFGAGKIGRSFIGQLFSTGGYEVVFVDVYQPVIDELNRRRSYNVIIKSNIESVITVQNVRAVFAGDTDNVIEEIATAGIAAVSVGLNGLKSVIPLIANGLLKRFENKGAKPLDIIIAENLRNAADFMKHELAKYLPESFQLTERVGLIETSIGKMVPVMQKKDMETDMLQVFAESYNTLILDKMAFKNPIPQIDGIAPKENIKAWVDRKLFIHNLGHATAAYLGFLLQPNAVYLYEVLDNPKIKEKVRDTMLEAASILLIKYPDEFTIESLTLHIDDLLFRFQNKALGDTIHRIGCDLQRKLGKEDRLSGIIHLAMEYELPTHLILKILVCGCHFKATNQEKQKLSFDIEFEKIYNRGIREILRNICGFDESNTHELSLIEEAERIDDVITFLYE